MEQMETHAYGATPMEMGNLMIDIVISVRSSGLLEALVFGRRPSNINTLLESAQTLTDSPSWGRARGNQYDWLFRTADGRTASEEKKVLSWRHWKEPRNCVGTENVIPKQNWRSAVLCQLRTCRAVTSNTNATSITQ
jgi:hypothetical protein